MNSFDFPPEVKIEYSLKLWKKIKDSTFITFNYENEHYRHYAFIDSNDNIWSQDFNEGSIQRTKTILIFTRKDYFLLNFYILHNVKIIVT